MQILSRSSDNKANGVLVTEADLQTFSKQWPCSRIPEGVCVSFYFDANGLCDITWHSDQGIDIPEPEHVDGGAMVALSQDAEAFLKQA